MSRRQVRFSSSKYNEMRLRPELCPGSHWGVYSGPRPSSWFSGSRFAEGDRRGGEERYGVKGRGAFRHLTTRCQIIVARNEFIGCSACMRELPNSSAKAVAADDAFPAAGVKLRRVY